MSYRELILQEAEFTYSANIQFDIESDRKLAQFIPNEAMLSLLKEFFIDMIREKPAAHSRILYGSYGTGKSHFLTILGQLLGKTQLDGDGYPIFLKRVSDYDDALSNDIQTFVSEQERKPFLIVPIVFDFDDFEKCIYFSLQRALERAQIKVDFKIFYTQAAQLLEKWESLEESRERLNASCEKHGVTISGLKDSLKFMEKDSEEVFQNIFSDVTFGVNFIYETENIVDILEQANRQIADSYSGIVFIFDEFGRYMEDNIKTLRVMAVQRIAEFCDHSSWNDHIILVSHKEIAQYTKGYSSFISDEWKKVEGRYKPTSLNDKDEQCLTLLEHILIKDEKEWREFKKLFSGELGKLALETVDFKGFLTNLTENESLCEMCFPLHPISLYVLDKLSKRVAQSERTFFTYLASKNENSLFQFLQEHQLDTFHFVGLDAIYDYFEPNILSLQSDPIYDWYRKLRSAMAKAGKSSSVSSLEVKILKAIALIGILGETEVLIADRKTLLSVIDGEKDALGEVIDWLCEKRIIRYFGLYKWYEFYDTSIFNIDDMVEEELVHVNDAAMLSKLNESLVDFVIYPHRYNRDYKISRVLIPVFVTPEEMKKRTFADRLSPWQDGYIVMVLGEADTSVDEMLLPSCQFERAIVFCSRDCKELREAARRFTALLFLELKKEQYTQIDPTFEKELDFHKGELASEIHRYIRRWRSNFEGDSFVVVSGKHISVHSEAELNECASLLMYDSFPDTLIVNNELINKNTLTSSILTAKKNAIRAILGGEGNENYFGLPFLSPDYIAVRSVLVKNGYYGDLEPESLNRLSDGRKPQNVLREKLDAMLCNAREASIAVEEILRPLRMPPFGLREGYLSLLLAYWLAPYRKSLLVDSHGTEQEITVELFEEMVRRPQDFKLSISTWSSEQQQYLDRLEDLFSSYLDEALLGKNRLKAIYEAMFLHFKTVAKLARVTELYVSEPCKQYRTLMGKSYTNYSQFLFQDLNTLAGDYVSSFALIQSVKEELENVIEKVEKQLEKELRQLFELGNKDLLSYALAALYESSWSSKHGKAFDYYTNIVLEITGSLSGKEERHEVLTSLAKGMTGFEMKYWNDSHKDEMMERLASVKENLERYQLSSELGENESKVVLVSPSGEEHSVIFDKKELSDVGVVMKNKINSTLQNFVQGVSYDEKIQVLLTLLDELIHSK